MQPIDSHHEGLLGGIRNFFEPSTPNTITPASSIFHSFNWSDFTNVLSSTSMAVQIGVNTIVSSEIEQGGGGVDTFGALSVANNVNSTWMYGSCALNISAVISNILFYVIFGVYCYLSYAYRSSEDGIQKTVAWYMLTYSPMVTDILNVCISAYLLAIGNLLLPCMVLTVLAISHACNAKILPQSISDGFQFVISNDYVTTVSKIFCGFLPYQVYGVLMLCYCILSDVEACLHGKRSVSGLIEDAIPKNQLDALDFLYIVYLSLNNEFRSNHSLLSHFRLEKELISKSLIECKESDINDNIRVKFLEYFDKWCESDPGFRRVLLSKAKDDQVFVSTCIGAGISLHGDPREIEKIACDYARVNLDDAMHRLHSESIGGLGVNTSRLRSCVYYIHEYFEKKINSEKRDDIIFLMDVLMSISVQVGNYCAPGVVSNLAENIFVRVKMRAMQEESINTESNSDSLLTFHLLLIMAQQLRKHLFDRFVYIIQTVQDRMSLGIMEGMNSNVHMYNSLKEIVAGEFSVDVFEQGDGDVVSSIFSRKQEAIIQRLFLGLITQATHVGTIRERIIKEGSSISGAILANSSSALGFEKESLFSSQINSDNSSNNLFLMALKGMYTPPYFINSLSSDMFDQNYNSSRFYLWYTSWLDRTSISKEDKDFVKEEMADFNDHLFVLLPWEVLQKTTEERCHNIDKDELPDFIKEILSSGKKPPKNYGTIVKNKKTSSYFIKISEEVLTDPVTLSILATDFGILSLRDVTRNIVFLTKNFPDDDLDLD